MALVSMSAIMSAVPMCTSLALPELTISYAAKYFLLINLERPRKLIDSSEERAIALRLSCVVLKDIEWSYVVP